MQLSRRGFLGTMLAAAIGTAANFDPLKGLWIPGVGRSVAAAEPLIEAAGTVDVDQVLELNDLALRFAKQMAERLHGHRAVVLREVMCERVGHINLGALRVEELGAGAFSPAPHRVFTTVALPVVAAPGTVNATLNGVCGAMRLAVDRFDMFAPIGTELRRGVPFSGALVGVATDPESGLSARAIRFTQTAGVARPTPMTSFEIAVGNWHGAGARSRRHAIRGTRRPACLLDAALLEEDANVRTSAGDWRV